MGNDITVKPVVTNKPGSQNTKAQRSGGAQTNARNGNGAGGQIDRGMRASVRTKVTASSPAELAQMSRLAQEAKQKQQSGRAAATVQTNSLREQIINSPAMARHDSKASAQTHQPINAVNAKSSAAPRGQAVPAAPKRTHVDSDSLDGSENSTLLQIAQKMLAEQNGIGSTQGPATGASPADSALPIPTTANPLAPLADVVPESWDKVSARMLPGSLPEASGSPAINALQEQISRASGQPIYIQDIIFEGGELKLVLLTKSASERLKKAAGKKPVSAAQIKGVPQTDTKILSLSNAAAWANTRLKSDVGSKKFSAFLAGMKTTAEQSICNSAAIEGPALLQMMAWIETNGRSHEGVYRLAASNAKLSRCMTDTMNGDPASNDVDTIADVIKRLMRGVASPIITPTEYAALLAAFKTDPIDDTAIKRVIQSLPDSKRELLSAIFAHMSAMLKFSADTKMDASNLAIVFSAALGFHCGDSSYQLAEERLALFKYLHANSVTHLPPSLPATARITTATGALIGLLHKFEQLGKKVPDSYLRDRTQGATPFKEGEIWNEDFLREAYAKGNLQSYLEQAYQALDKRGLNPAVLNDDHSRLADVVIRCIRDDQMALMKDVLTAAQAVLVIEILTDTEKVDGKNLKRTDGEKRDAISKILSSEQREHCRAYFESMDALALKLNKWSKGSHTPEKFAVNVRQAAINALGHDLEKLSDACYGNASEQPTPALQNKVARQLGSLRDKIAAATANLLSNSNYDKYFT